VATRPRTPLRPPLTHVNEGVQPEEVRNVLPGRNELDGVDRDSPAAGAGAGGRGARARERAAEDIDEDAVAVSRLRPALQDDRVPGLDGEGRDLDHRLRPRLKNDAQDAEGRGDAAEGEAGRQLPREGHAAEGVRQRNDVVQTLHQVAQLLGVQDQALQRGAAVGEQNRGRVVLRLLPD
jgi:hypothetical protein